MQFSITVLPGDGVGPEVIAAAVGVLRAVEGKFGHDFQLTYGSIGAAAFEKEGTALPEKTLEVCKNCDAVLFGAVGDPKWEVPNISDRPELGYGLIRLRKELGLFANVRPVKLFPSVVNCTRFKPEVVEGVDFIIVRELSSGIYYSQPKRS